KKVYINDQPLDEPYAHYLEASTLPEQFREETPLAVLENFGPVTVPPGQYFMMGDNRDHPADSRLWGFLSRDLIKGKAVVIYWSYEGSSADYENQGAGATLKDMVSVVAHFFTRTRWDRMFHPIR